MLLDVTAIVSEHGAVLKSLNKASLVLSSHQPCKSRSYSDPILSYALNFKMVVFQFCVGTYVGRGHIMFTPINT